MALTDTGVKNLKFSGKPTKHADGQALYLLVSATGKYWRLDYKFADKRKTLALGQYPEVSLAKARKRRDEARELLADSIDPGAKKKADRAALKAKHENTFEAVAADWLERTAKTRKGGTEARLTTWLTGDCYPVLGKMPVAEITAPDVKRVLDRLHNREVSESLRRVHGLIGRVLKFACAAGLASRDVTQDMKLADLYPPVKTVSHAAIVEPVAFGGLLRAIDGYRGGPVATAALKLAPLLFVRPGELRHAEWSEIDLDAAVWEIPAEKMKMGVALTVPLPSQAVGILRQLKDLTGHGKYVFPSNRGQGRPMSENTVNGALRALGYGPDVHVGHGFRAAARTILDQNLKQDVRFIEMQMAHAVRDALGAVYNRTSFLPERTAMMQAWADHLDRLRDGAQVIPMVRAA